MNRQLYEYVYLGGVQPMSSEFSRGLNFQEYAKYKFDSHLSFQAYLENKLEEEKNGVHHGEFKKCGSRLCERCMMSLGLKARDFVYSG